MGREEKKRREAAKSTYNITYARNESRNGSVRTYHGKVNAAEVATGHLQVPGAGGAHAQHQGVVIGPQVVHVDVHADVGVGYKLDALFAQQVDPAVDRLLLELHVGDPVHEQPSDPVGALVHGDLVPLLVQFVGARQAGRSRPHHRHRHSRPLLGDARDDEPVLPRPVDDGVLDVLDGNGAVDEARDAAALAGGGTHAAGELGEVVGFVQALNRILPLAVVHEVVPLGDEVVDGAAGVGLAEGRAAVHAPGGLDLALEGGVVELVSLDGVELAPIQDPLEGAPVRLRIALVVQEPTQLFDARVGPIAALDPTVVFETDQVETRQGDRKVVDKQENGTK